MATPTLLSTDEPAPFELVNAGGQSDLLLVCDHASNRIPASLGTLGLSAMQLASHIGWDPGAADVARKLSVRLDAPLLLSNYSRLVIDCNRWPDDPNSIPAYSAGIAIPGNANLVKEAALNRRRCLFDPYQDTIAAWLSKPEKKIHCLLSIHSFTPSLGGIDRPWSIGVCYRLHAPLAKQWQSALRARTDEPVGDNEPYEVEEDVDYTIPVQGERRGIPSIMLEIRQDQIEDDAAAQRWSNLIAECWFEGNRSVGRSTPLILLKSFRNADPNRRS